MSSQLRKQIATKWRHYIRPIVNKVYSVADEWKLTDPSWIYSENYFKKRKKGDRKKDADNVSKVLYGYFNPNSVIDFGCAVGHYLDYYNKKDIKIKGVEGNYKGIENAVVPKKFIEQADLREPYFTEQEYDLAICFEVAEHLSGQYADTLVKSITSSSNIIVFTAAAPGQGGTHHVNEQPPSYWISKFEDRGFEYDDHTTQEVKEQISVSKSKEIKDNLMIFQRKC